VKKLSNALIGNYKRLNLGVCPLDVVSEGVGSFEIQKTQKTPKGFDLTFTIVPSQVAFIAKRFVAV